MASRSILKVGANLVFALFSRLLIPEFEVWSLKFEVWVDGLGNVGG